MLHRKGRDNFLRNWFLRKLSLQNAKKEKIDETEEFLEEVEKIKNSTLKQFALREVLKKVSVSDEFVKEYYEENIDSFKQPESWKASHILVDTKEESEKINEEIKNGKSFANAATEYSKCPSKERGGDLGFFTSGNMVKEFEDSVKEMEVGEIKSVMV